MSEQRPDIAAHAMRLLDEWYAQAMRTATHGHDPMWTVLEEGGPLHTRGHLPGYLKRST